MLKEESNDDSSYNDNSNYKREEQQKLKDEIFSEEYITVKPTVGELKDKIKVLLIIVYVLEFC